MTAMLFSVALSGHHFDQTLDLPFDGAVHRSTTKASLRSGDVLLSTTGAMSSAAIRKFSKGPFSHASIYAERTGEIDWIIDATTQDKVSRRSFEEAFKGTKYVVVVRNERLSSSDRKAVIDFASLQVGKSYDYLGAFSSVGLSINGKFVSLGFISEKSKLYCSELVVEAFDSLGKPEFMIAKKGESLTPNALRSLVWTDQWACVGVIWSR